jgi:hypothetical protein
MTEYESIEQVLKGIGRRRRLWQLWMGLWQGLLAGGIIWLTALIVYKLFPVSSTLLPWAGAVSGCVVLGFLLRSWLEKPGPLQMARFVDSEEKLQERLSTALEMGGLPDSEWKQLLVQDAARHVDKVNARKLIAFDLPRISRWAFLVLLLGAGLGFVPEYRSKAHLQKQEETAVIKETGRELAGLTKRSLEHRPPVLDQTRRSLESVQELGEHLSKAKLTRSDALKELANTTDRLRQEARQLAQNPAMQRLQRAARTPSEGSGSPEELQQKIAQMEKRMGDTTADSRALERLKRDLQKTREAAAAMGNEEGASGQEAENQLADALAGLSKQMEGLGLSSEAIEQAMAALANSEIGQLLQNLDLATFDLEEMAQMARSLEQMKMQLAQIGRDLGEHLQFGQAMLAQSRLQKMAKDLRSGELSQEKMAEMLEELERALAPASAYGDVQKLLKEGMGEMQKGNQAAAADKLQEAADRLGEMMDGVGDLESLLAALQALGHAQFCIGNCQGWGLQPGQFGSAGQGGGFGPGVGTWADDSRWIDPQQGPIFDNSGFLRPDMDPRGISDREAGLAEGLRPDRIKGQFSPGGSMPSITLKGVSIKGMSQVQFEETAAAAQSDAQTALGQDRVPRAYQNAVRNYFDDF